ncbi:ABC transporter substrate-binding protein [Pelomonas sp. KK5]|uniref:substrate-binding periplasmic protein n=1 Tax=Pelomonas sp. KK5 TaxID=1855730 RepID=UPI001301E2ED|nr:transporter substrate-binding domain-containing protein [Pelomonas sp. KK5]
MRAARAAPADFRMAYFETYSPLSFVQPDGRMGGILVDVLGAVLNEDLGLHCLHEGFPWPRAQLRVTLGTSDAVCTIATADRLAYAVAVDEPVVTATNTIFVRADHPQFEALSRVKSLDELKALNLNVLSYSANGWAREKLQGFDVTWGGDFNSALKMLVARRGDLMVENALTMSYTLQRTPGGEQVRMLPNRLDQANFQLLIGKRSPHVERVASIGRALQQFKRTPAYADVFKRYGLSAAMRGSS